MKNTWTHTQGLKAVVNPLLANNITPQRHILNSLILVGNYTIHWLTKHQLTTRTSVPKRQENVFFQKFNSYIAFSVMFVGAVWPSSTNSFFHFPAVSSSSLSFVQCIVGKKSSLTAHSVSDNLYFVTFPM